MEINDNDARTDNMEKTLANALQHITRRTKSSRIWSVSGVELAKLKTRKTKSTVDFYKLSKRKQNYAEKSDIIWIAVSEKNAKTIDKNGPQSQQRTQDK